MASIREQASGRVQGVAKHPSGKRVTKVFRLKGQALKWATDQEAAWRTGNRRDPRAGRITVAEWHARWWTARIAAPSTLRLNETHWRLRVGPTWGSWPMETVTRLEVAGWAKAMIAEGVGLRTAEQSVGLLSLLFAAALDEDPPLIAGLNPCRGVVAALPEAPQRPPTYFTREQAAALLAVLDEPWRTIVDLDLHTGLRWGELGGLLVRNVDILHGLVHVQFVNDRGTLREYPKSKRSRRAVPIPPHLLVPMARAMSGRGPDDAVFVGAGGGLLDYDRSRTVWDRAIAAARTCGRPGCPDAAHHVPAWTPHSMRHTAASWLVMAGVDLYRVQALLGHESYVTTMRYSHLAPDAHEAVREVWKTLGADWAQISPGSGGGG